MEDDAPIIYGLEFQARTLTAQIAETEVIRFFVGTQSLKFDNQIHQLEYEEETNCVTKTVYLHSVGEVWHIGASPTHSNLISTCYYQTNPNGKCEMHGAVWRIPSESTVNNYDTSAMLPSVELVADLQPGDNQEEFKRIIWEPVSGKRLISLTDSSIHLWDLEDNFKPVMKSCVSPEKKGRPKFTSASWNPHHNNNIVATAIDTSVHSWDLRTMKPSWSIENAHGQLVRELDFNPNKQYYLATCGDDCQTKFWDVRNNKSPLLVLSDHSHWVWSVRYNSSHDQLVLTSSSDSRVILSRTMTVSSEPYGRLVEEEETDKDGSTNKAVSDGVISVYEEHEDSVYAAEWSSADPWLFASLSYDGRLVINKVPRAEKYKILL